MKSTAIKSTLNPHINYESHFTSALFYAALITSSFDIFLVLNFGVNLRATQFFSIIFVSIVGLFCLSSTRIILPIGILPLAIWSVINLMFVFNNSWLGRPLAYQMYLMFNIILVFSVVNFYHTKQKIYKLVQVYFVSFILVSLFGIYQFVVALSGFDAPLVVQWWKENLPRVNGFSYEPSYFATYMIMGWVMSLCFLEQSKYIIISRSIVLATFSLTSISIFLSSSRMGWLFMGLFMAKFPLKMAFSLITLKVQRSTLLLFMALAAVCIVVVLYVSTNLNKLLFLLEGLGVLGTSAHSSASRVREMLDTLQIFLNSPIMGYSLGGISVAIGELRGETVNSFELAKQHEGMSIFVEVLAATGIVGGIFFILYLWNILYRPYQLLRRLRHEHDLVLVKSLLMALLVELFILQFNQNILRPPLWIHIAILSATYHTFLAPRKEAC